MRGGLRATPPTGRRLPSVDCLRGLAVAGMILANNPGDRDHVYAMLRHAAWDGCTLADLVFPLFLFLVGVSVALAVDGYRIRDGLAPGFWPRVLRRACVLFLLGLAENAWLHLSLAELRLPGVLQRIAVVYLVAVWLHVRLRTDRGLALTVVATLLGYWLLLALVPVPGLGRPSLDKAVNLESWLDQLVLGRHIWKAGTAWDPEGLLSTLPAAALGLIGVLVGRRLRAGGLGPAAGAALGLAMIGLGLAWGMVFPLNKSLCTSSFVLFTGGIGLALLAVAHGLLDDAGPRLWSAPLRALGQNALTVYVAASLGASILRLATFPGPSGARVSAQQRLFQALFGGWPDPFLASVAWGVLFLALAWLVAWALAKRGIAIRA